MIRNTLQHPTHRGTFYPVKNVVEDATMDVKVKAHTHTKVTGYQKEEQLHACHRGWAGHLSG